MNWDDPAYIYENQHIRSIDLAFFKWAFSSFHAANWHPVTWLLHAVDYAVWGTDPIGHHLTSIVFHGLNTFLVVILVIRLILIATVYRVGLFHAVSVWVLSAIASIILSLFLPF